MPSANVCLALLGKDVKAKFVTCATKTPFALITAVCARATILGMDIIVRKSMTPVSQILAKTREFAPWDLTDLTPVNALKVTVDHIVNPYVTHAPAILARITARVRHMATGIFARVLRASLELTANLS